MARPIPIVVCVDVEPDDRQVARAAAPRWTGFESLRPWLTTLRSRLPAPAGAPHISWFVRMDAQVAETFGSLAWALTHYARDIDALRSAGDELGIHTHAYRWDGGAQSWIIDHGNQIWVEQSVRDSFAAFRAALGFACRTFRFGDHWMNDATVTLLAELGVSVDVTLEPGMPAAPALIAREAHTGTIADLTAVPKMPYRPSVRDFRVAAPSRHDGLWMMPVTTGRLPAHLRRGRALYRWLTRAADASFDVLALNLALAPALFRAIAAPLLGPPTPPCLVLPVRSDVGMRSRELARLRSNVDYLLQHPLRDRFAFCTPLEALELIHIESRPPASSLRPEAPAAGM